MKALKIGAIAVVMVVAAAGLFVGGRISGDLHDHGGEDNSRHAPVATPIRSATEGIPPAPVDRGAQPAEFRIENGVKIFEFTLQKVLWSPRSDAKSVEAWAFNGQVPGPIIRVQQGDQVRVVVRNELDEDATVHWHALEVPNSMDGVGHVTQPPIKPGEHFTYEFTVRNEPGTYMYHAHMNVFEQITKGVYGPFVVEDKDPLRYDKDFLVMLSGPMEGHYLINGKSFPDTDSWEVAPGDRLHLRVINISPIESHPMHFHGHTLKVIAIDGRHLDVPFRVATLDVAPGQTYDVEVVADADPGVWLFHCHILHHVTGADPASDDITKAHAGMIIVVAYK